VKVVDGWSVLALPGLAVLIAFFGSALAYLIYRSFTDPGVENYTDLFTGFYLSTFIATFRASVVIVLITLVLGYPYAYAMRVGSPALRVALILLLVLEFSTSWLARIYSWQQLLQDSGVINSALINVGLLKDPIHLVRNDIGMVIGTTHVLLPFMILTLYANMRSINLSSMVAARSLGAKGYQAFFGIFVPATKAGIAGGCSLIFVMSLGFYVAPALLGDPAHEMISAAIVRKATASAEFGPAAAMGLLLLVVTLLILGVVTAVWRRASQRNESE
jgi:putative spermidine/putrescine transport system permease protein